MTPRCDSGHLHPCLKPSEESQVNRCSSLGVGELQGGKLGLMSRFCPCKILTGSSKAWGWLLRAGSRMSEGVRMTQREGSWLCITDLPSSGSSVPFKYTESCEEAESRLARGCTPGGGSGVAGGLLRMTKLPCVILGWEEEAGWRWQTRTEGEPRCTKRAVAARGLGRGG